MSKRIAVLGVGAIGGTTGAYLARAGHDVTLIDQWPANVERIKAEGLTVETLEGQFTVQARALHLTEVSSAQQLFDVVLLAVKSYDTVWSTEFIRPYLAPEGFVVLAQNGINDETIAAIVGWPRAVGCVVTFGAGMYEPGVVQRTSPVDRDSFTLGEPNGIVGRRLTELSETLSAVGPTKTTTNLWGERWSKLGINCMSNAVSGFTGLNSAEIRNNPDTRWVRIRIGAEVVRIAEASGVTLEIVEGLPSQRFLDALEDGAAREEVEGKMIEFGKGIGTGRPSLGQDVMKGRKTEVDHLNGYVVRKGEEAGLSAPVNQAVVEITKRIEAGELKPSVENLKHIE